MRLLIQRVTEASVTVDKKLVSEIKHGLLVFIGIAKEDTEAQLEWLCNKLIGLRIFEDEGGKMNLSLADIKGEVLLVSQFTLYANCQRGRRPDFTNAGKPDKAEELYEKFATMLAQKYSAPKMGIFGADMKVALLNDGPVTILLER